jgi:hypothetical protein
MTTKQIINKINEIQGTELNLFAQKIYLEMFDNKDFKEIKNALTLRSAKLQDVCDSSFAVSSEIKLGDLS